MEDYVVLKRLGCGAFSEVLLAQRRSDSVPVALKRVFQGKPSRGAGTVHSAERERTCLTACKHDCVVSLNRSFKDGSTDVLELELMDSDLGSIVGTAVSLLPDRVICYVMLRLLSALEHIHSLGVLHRDVKPANILVGKRGEVKLGDFGLARQATAAEVAAESNLSDASLEWTYQVQSRWYRAPEILLASRQYGAAVDMWSAGCILAELLELSPLFQGATDIDQLCRVIQVLGSPSTADWPELELLPDWGKISFEEMAAVPLRSLLPNASADAISLVHGLLQWNPAHRFTAAAALRHPYFTRRGPALLPLGREPREPASEFDVDDDHLFAAAMSDLRMLLPNPLGQLAHAERE